MWEEEEQSDNHIIALQTCNEVVDHLIENKEKYGFKPDQLASIEKVKSVLNTPGEELLNHITISSIYSLNDETRYYSFTIMEGFLQIESGGSVYTEGVGSDSYYEEIYCSNQGNDISIIMLDNWKEGFYYNLGENGEGLRIEDESDS